MEKVYRKACRGGEKNFVYLGILLAICKWRVYTTLDILYYGKYALTGCALEEIKYVKNGYGFTGEC